MLCVQVYLALSRLLAKDGLAPLQALAEAEADLAALAPDAKARVGPAACVLPVQRCKPHSADAVPQHMCVCVQAQQVPGWGPAGGMGSDVQAEPYKRTPHMLHVMGAL